MTLHHVTDREIDEAIENLRRRLIMGPASDDLGMHFDELEGIVEGLDRVDDKIEEVLK